MSFNPHRRGGRGGGGVRTEDVPVGIVIDRSTRVYVSGIPFSLIEQKGVDTLRAEFESFGPVETYSLHTDSTGRFIGTAMCTYRNPADANLAIYRMNNAEVEGSRLTVTPARDHGVVLAHQVLRQEKQSKELDWKHDKFDQLQKRGAEGGLHSERGGRWGGRGRGRGAGRFYRSNDQFEKYVAQRDRARRGGGSEEEEAAASALASGFNPASAFATSDVPPPPPSE